LNALAAAYLQSLAETNSGCPLEADISQTATLNSGDLVTISNGAELGLSGELCDLPNYQELDEKHVGNCNARRRLSRIDQCDFFN
jgi:hypothetical protein